MMKNDFYFILKAFFVLKVFKFCPEFLVMWKSNLIVKLAQLIKYDVRNIFPQDHAKMRQGE